MDLRFDAALAERFARLALACVEREYPNKIAHAMMHDGDVKPPRLLTPAFYGCFDWHSAVHGHWLLARVSRLFPEASFAPECRAALTRNITPARIAAEVRYFQGEGRAGFERPYGLAWLLTLGAELRLASPALAAVLQPLEDAAVEALSKWLPRLLRPDRSGQHPNTAFSLGLALDYARAVRDLKFEALLIARARDFYLADHGCPVAWEPAGEDFLSGCLAEADLMRRVLPRSEFEPWLRAFLPDLTPLVPVASPDPSDGKLAHLDGLNLSRAWMLLGIASSVSAPAPFEDLAEAHTATGLAAVTGEHYEGGHWLATFAVYLLSAAGR
jgi:hypothetical protein